MPEAVLSAIEAKRYLERLGLSAFPGRTDVKTVSTLHRAQSLSIPFESLHLHFGEGPQLNLQAVVQHVLHQKRGGICYELNLLFAAALRYLGYQPIFLSAAARQADGSYPPWGDHMALGITIDGQDWLADAGFGSQAVPVLPFGGQGSWQGEHYRLDEDTGAGCWAVQQEQEGSWQTLFRLKRTPCRIQDFEAMANYHYQAPTSPFAEGPVCALATTEGRKTLTAKYYKEIRGQKENRLPVESQAHFLGLAQQHFGIRLPYL